MKRKKREEEKKLKGETNNKTGEYLHLEVGGVTQITSELKIKSDIRGFNLLLFLFSTLQNTTRTFFTHPPCYSLVDTSFTHSKWVELMKEQEVM